MFASLQHSLTRTCRNCIVAALTAVAAQPVSAGDPFVPEHHPDHRHVEHNEVDRHHVDHHAIDRRVTDHDRVGNHVTVDVNRPGAGNRVVNVHPTSVTNTTVVHPRIETPAAHYVVGTGGNLYVFSVEVDHKKIEKGQPDTDNKEARQFAQALEEKGKGLYKNVYSRVLVNKQADRHGILGGLTWLEKSMTPRDVAVVFISSHGGYDPMGFFGVQPAGYDEKHQQETAVWGPELRSALGRIPGRIVFLLETCNAGVFLLNPNHIDPVPNALVICSTAKHESSGADMGYAAIRGLSGAAGGGVVTAGQLGRYVSAEVSKATHGKQHVTIAAPKEGEFSAIPLAHK